MKGRVIAEQDRILLERVRRAIREIAPTARIILYGSRARGDAEPESDWDLLVLLDGAVDHQRTLAVRHRLYALERETEDCPVLSALVVGKEEWSNPLYRAMPMHASVEREGIEL